jgi:hypothetical protein
MFFPIQLDTISNDSSPAIDSNDVIFGCSISINSPTYLLQWLQVTVGTSFLSQTLVNIEI